ncbi:MAG: DUF4390 domain-containing protein [Syntrophobacteraceae bacterium]
MRLFLSRILICPLLAIMAACLPFAVCAASEAQIVDMSVEKSGTELAVSFRLENCFTAKMEEAIQNGVPTTFRILVALEKPSAVLVRSVVVDFAIEHTIKYNRLNNEYQVHLPEHPQKILVTKDFDQAKIWMSTVSDLPVIQTCWLRTDLEYTLRVKAELSKVALPLFLRYIIFWVSLWDFETDWQAVQFTM